MEELLTETVGEEMLKWFDLGKVEKRKRGGRIDFKDEIIIEMREKSGLIPTVKRGITLESKGFHEPIELITHPVGSLATYVEGSGGTKQPGKYMTISMTFDSQEQS